MECGRAPWDTTAGSDYRLLVIPTAALRIFSGRTFEWSVAIAPVCSPSPHHYRVGHLLQAALAEDAISPLVVFSLNGALVVALSNCRFQIIQIYELVGLTAQLRCNHRRLRLHRRDDAHAVTLIL